MAGTSATISVRDLHRATMTTEDQPNVPAKYAKPARLKTEAVNVSITPTRVSQAAYGDGGVAEQFEGTNGGDISVQIHALPIADAVAMFGLTIDANGVVVKSDNDTAPYGALGFVTDKANGKSVYVWVYKVRWQVPDYVVDTKTDTVTFQQPSITGKYMARKDGTFVVDGKKKDIYQSEYDEESENFDPAIAEAWFDEVHEPVSPTVATPPEGGDVGNP